VIDYKGEIDDVIDARLGDRLRNVEWHKTQPRFGGKGSASLQEAKCRAERLFSRFLKQIKVTKFYTNTLCAQKKKKKYTRSSISYLRAVRIDHRSLATTPGLAHLFAVSCVSQTVSRTGRSNG